MKIDTELMYDFVHWMNDPVRRDSGLSVPVRRCAAGAFTSHTEMFVNYSDPMYSRTTGGGPFTVEEVWNIFLKYRNLTVSLMAQELKPFFSEEEKGRWEIEKVGVMKTSEGFKILATAKEDAHKDIKGIIKFILLQYAPPHIKMAIADVLVERKNMAIENYQNTELV